MIWLLTLPVRAYARLLGKWLDARYGNACNGEEE